MSEPKTPEDALRAIQEAAKSGDIKFASDELAAQYDEEIQVIFTTLFTALKGRAPKRPIWVADGQTVGVVLDWTKETGYSPESHEALKTASAQLGIELTPKTVWEDAAAALRAKSPTTVKS